jgi:mRNA interferase HigB
MSAPARCYLLTSVPGRARLLPCRGRGRVSFAKKAEDVLRIYGHPTLAAFWQGHPDAAAPLRCWYREVAGRVWRGPADVRALYRSASFVGDRRVVFEIAGNTVRLVAWVEYALHGVCVRFVGTRADYDRIDVTKV